MADIVLNHKSLKALIKARDKAIQDGKDSFTFDGHELLVSYAKYLIEYAQTKLKK